jgi:sphingolipid C9-methyltransferase
LLSQYPAIANPTLPAEGPSAEHFSNTLLISLLVGVPAYITWTLGGGFKTWLFFALLVDLPILAAFWIVTSEVAPRKNERAKLPEKPVESYLTFHKAEHRDQYYGRHRIPLQTFQEMYFAGEVSFKGDCLEILEMRHDWAKFRFTLGNIKQFLTRTIPDMIFHTVSQGWLFFHLS